MLGNKHLYGVKMIFNMEKLDKFPCTGCGCCCKRIDELLIIINKLESPAKEIMHFPYKHENGRCEKLGKNNECTIYENRPIVCSFEKFIDAFNLNKDKIFGMSIKSCNKMMDEDNICNKFRIK